VKLVEITSVRSSCHDGKVSNSRVRQGHRASNRLLPSAGCFGGTVSWPGNLVPAAVGVTWIDGERQFRLSHTVFARIIVVKDVGVFFL
jgi:hypothetical protein